MDFDEGLEEIAVFFVLLGNNKVLGFVFLLVIIVKFLRNYGQIELIFLLFFDVLIIRVIFVVNLQETQRFYQ